VTTIPEPETRRLRLPALRQLLTDYPVIALTFVFVALYVVTDIVNRAQSGSAFLTPTQVATTFLFAAPLALLAAGQTLVMLTAGVDLSVATTATAAAFAIAWQGQHGALALLLALGIGAGIGFVNGIGVAVFRVNALVMTLGTSAVTLGLLTIYTQKQWEPHVPGYATRLGSERFFHYIPWNILLWAPLATLIILGLRYSGYGRALYAVGDNPIAARLAGIRVWQVLLLVYVLCGMLSALAGMLLLGFNNAADLGLAAPFLLPSVAAVVIGGTSILGGYGGYAGTILGALILTILDSLLTILNATAAVKQMLYGGIILALAWLYARTAGTE
jgi:ribose transport system permease protein